MDLKVPSDEDLVRLHEMLELNDVERAFNNSLPARWNVYQNKTVEGRIGFYLELLNESERLFPDRSAVQRRIKYQIAKTTEWLATNRMHTDLKRAELYEKAANWFQDADETVGFYSDYCLEQAEVWRRAAYFRKLGGLDDEKTRNFYNKGTQLVETFYEGRTGQKPQIIDIPFTDYEKKWSM